LRNIEGGELDGPTEFALDDGYLKDLMLGDGKKGYSAALCRLRERIFNAVLNAKAKGQTYRNGYPTRKLTLARRKPCASYPEKQARSARRRRKIIGVRVGDCKTMKRGAISLDL